MVSSVAPAEATFLLLMIYLPPRAQRTQRRREKREEVIAKPGKNEIFSWFCNYLFSFFSASLFLCV